MKTVSVGELRQNPTPALADVEAGAAYSITRHNREIARLVPPGDEAVIIPPKKRSGARTSRLPRIDITSASSIDELIDEEKGEW